MNRSGIDIVGIGDHQTEYPETYEDNFETNEEYLTIAKKIIRTFAPRFGAELAEQMLRSDDAISNMATAVMMADWRWNPEYRSKQGTVRTRRSYRNQCCLWAMQSYISRQKYNKQNHMSLDTMLSGSASEFTLQEIIPDFAQCSPEDTIVEKEHLRFVNSTVKKILGSKYLTEQQANFIERHHIDGETLVSIGNDFGISREAVRQSIERGITNIRREF